MKLNEKKNRNRKHSLRNSMFIAVMIDTYVVLGLLIFTGTINDSFPISYIRLFQNIAKVCAVIIFISFIFYGLLYSHFNNKKKKYKKIVANIEKNCVSENSDTFSINNIAENEKLAKKYQEYEMKVKKVQYAEKAICSVLLTITVISIDIPILYWVTVLFLAIILAMDSVSSYSAELSKTYIKKKKNK